MNSQRVKIIEERNTRALETAVNTFTEKLDQEPVKISFSHYSKKYEGGERWAWHIAYITYNITK